ncbi:MAG: glucuronate isomerase [Lentisphaeria bacterium]|nr:glucuronate isomerase [Lentisphaeria bacterium]
MAFLDDSYLISNEAGKRIFAAIRQLPVIDPHNHADIGEILANENYPDLWKLLGATDHYVWEVMRKCGVAEEFVTGDRSPREKFLALAKIMPRAVGNPVYEWLHLDLRCLGITELMSEATGEIIWEKGLVELARPENRPLALLTGKLNVEVMCSTDDPADLLDRHDQVNALAGRTLVRPTWRPDKVMNIDAPGWTEYLEKLGARFQRKLTTYSDLVDVLRLSHDYFHEHGCRASDHGVSVPPSIAARREEAEQLFRRGKDGEKLEPAQVEAFRGRILWEAARLDAEKDWVFQYHAGAVRNVRDSLWESLGADVGGDVCNLAQDFLPGLVRLLNAFDNKLKIVLYTLDPAQQATLATLTRAFGDRVRLGSAWWLCDTPIGMKRQLEYIGSVDVLWCFAGMVSDSRKLTSYGSRFEMFRRVLADVLGNMAERGQAPEELLTDLAVHICSSGPREFFGI